VVLALVRIVATYPVYSHTFDEPEHLAAGLEWWSGKYTYDVHHPPLARAAIALGPLLFGARSMGEEGVWREASAVVRTGRGYNANLALARAGVLPFFLLACLVVWWWGRRVSSERAGAFAVVVFTLVPPVVAHAGLATTDMPLVATLLALSGAWVRWGDRPRALGRAAMLGLAAGLALATKFSAIPFFGIGAIATAFLLRPWRSATRRELARSLGVVALTAFGVLWASYQFSVGPAGGVWLPFPEFFTGLNQLALHNAAGHFTYLLGTPGTSGRIVFFPIVLLVKTPLSVLVLLGLATAWAVQQWRRSGKRDHAALVPLVMALGLFVVSMAANINAGVRHILPIYALGAVTIGAFLAQAWRYRGTLRTSAAALLGALVLESTMSHPEALAYFNVLVPNDPGRVLVDSDLDWGQDLHRLADTVRARGITHLALAYYGSTDHARDVLPVLRPLSHVQPDTGWLAISETYYRMGAISNPGGVWQIDTTAYRWIRNRHLVARIGKSIRLYFVPRSALPP
jgi:4-amino-4-deoxy-L-arabinose transferase-like glycosyltransferase